MRRAPLVLLTLFLFVVMLLGARAPAAKADLTSTVTGGTAKLFVPWTVTLNWGQDRVYAHPIDPSGIRLFAQYNGQIGNEVSFPITDGLVVADTMLGTVNMGGGISILKYAADYVTVEKQLDSTDPKIVAGASFITNALGIVPSPTADLVNATHTKDAATGVIHYEADAQMSDLTALVLNTYFSTSVFQGGQVIGHLTADINTAPLL